jgi:hypothetical protein
MLIFALPIVASAETGTEPTETPTETTSELSTTDKIVEYVKENIDKAVVIIVMLGYSIVESRLRGKTNGSITTLNNNAIAIAKSSAETIESAMSKVESIGGELYELKDKFETMLDEIRKSAEEKKNLEDALNHVETFLKSAKLATLELSNEVAELLVLANIPNSKKEELYARHTKAVHELEAVEEVTSDDGKEE